MILFKYIIICLKYISNNMNVPKKEELNCSGKLGKLYIKKNYPEFYEYLINTYTNTSTEKLAEKLYLYYNHLSEPPKCPVCGKNRPFLDFLSRGYQTYCSSKCSNSDKLIQEKKSKTCFEHYGVKHPAQNKKIKDKLVTTYIENNGGMGNASNSVREKQKKTMLKKYGYEYSLQNDNLLDKSKQTWIENYGGVGFGSHIMKEKITNTIKERYGGVGMASDIIRRRIVSTNIEKYGEESPMSTEEVKNKVKKTKLERYGDENYNNRKKTINTWINKYGVESPMSTEEIKNKVKKTKLERYGDENYNNKEKFLKTNIERYGVEHPMQIDCIKDKQRNTMIEKYGVKYPSLSQEIKDKIQQNNLKKYGVAWTCLLPEVQHPKGNKSKPNIYFSNILDNNGINYSMEYIIENRSYDFKLDNVLIEINPSATHNINWKPFNGNPIDKNYHFDKTKLAIDNGFRVINIWDWDDQNKIIKSLLPKTNIYARKCELKMVSKKEAKEFLNLYHFQNNCGGQKIIFGLYYNDELVEIMSFGKPRYNKKYEYELLRLCTKFEYNVIGGSEKLFKYFINNYNPSSIISYCDNSKFKGNVYKSLGFELKNYGTPSKHWYNIKTKQHITDNLLRQRGFDQLFKTDYGKGVSNEQLMRDNKFVEIYDAGQSVWVWKN